MFYLNMKNTVKNAKITTKSGKKKKAPSAKNGFHYITRTAHFSKHKENEKVEFVLSGNMPDWAKKNPSKFWASADQHEIERGRTSTSLTIALPNNLTVEQRKELTLALIQDIAGEHSFPFTCAIHTHKSEIDGTDQPHLHLMISERSTNFDDVYRTPEQFFKQYRPKNPTQGGAKKLTADELGFGRNYVDHMRELGETRINEYLAEYAPTKKIKIEGMELEVPSFFNRLSNHEYNKKFGTQLEDVPQIPRWKLHSSDPITQLEVEAQKQTIREIREKNNKQIYRKYYDLEIEKRQKLASEAETRRAAEAALQVPVPEPDPTPHFSAESDTFKFSETYDMTALEEVCRFNDDVRNVLKTQFLDSWKLKNQNFNYGIPAYDRDPKVSATIYNVNSSKISLDSELRSNYENHCLNILNALETHYSNKIDVFNKSFSMNISKFDLSTLIEYTNQHDSVIKPLLESIERYSDVSKNEVFTHHLDKIKEKQSHIEKIFASAQEYKSSHTIDVRQTLQKENRWENDSSNRFDF